MQHKNGEIEKYIKNGAQRDQQHPNGGAVEDG